MAYYDNVSPDFPALVETLLAGKAICENSYPALYRRLEDREDPDRVKAEEVLEALGRSLGYTAGVYYAVYAGIDGDVERQAEAVFSRYMGDMPVIMEFFEILRLANRGGDSFEAGDRISFSDALDRITSERSLGQRMVALALTCSRKKDPDPNQALNTLFTHLTDRGYLVLASRQEMIYSVTGEYTLFSQWLDFVHEAEGVDLSREDDDLLEPGKAGGPDSKQQALL